MCFGRKISIVSSAQGFVLTKLTHGNEDKHIPKRKLHQVFYFWAISFPKFSEKIFNLLFFLLTISEFQPFYSTKLSIWKLMASRSEHMSFIIAVNTVNLRKLWSNSLRKVNNQKYTSYVIDCFSDCNQSIESNIIIIGSKN